MGDQNPRLTHDDIAFWRNLLYWKLSEQLHHRNEFKTYLPNFRKYFNEKSSKLHIYISWVQAGYGSSSWWSMTISISVDFLLIFYFIDWISWIQLCIYTALADGVWQFQFLLIEVLMWRLCNWITLLGEKKAKSLFVIWSRSFVH